MTVEKEIIRFCAPTLTGIKPANLISLEQGKYPDLNRDIGILNKNLRNKNLCFLPICRCEKRVLLFVYNRSLLEHYLLQPAHSCFLLRFGYPMRKGFKAILYELIKRLMINKEFPHEVGLFLGYPLSDVEAFIQNEGKNFEMCGKWKVYNTPEESSLRFKQYEECTQRMLQKHQHLGLSLQELVLESA